MERRIIVQHKGSTIYEGIIDERQKDIYINLDKDTEDSFLSKDDVVDSVQGDNDNPVSSGAVYTAVNSINTILDDVIIDISDLSFNEYGGGVPDAALITEELYNKIVRCVAIKNGDTYYPPVPFGVFNDDTIFDNCTLGPNDIVSFGQVTYDNTNDSVVTAADALFVWYGQPTEGDEEGYYISKYAM